jgi:vacuolar protein sorting-associated protein 51
VFDLPKRMRAALAEDVLDTAVSFYAEAQPLLKKYGHRGTFRQIAADSDVVAREISQVGIYTPYAF